jgi:circadian clock protein KaiC
MSLVKLTTGINGLDSLTLGGIPEGRATLVTGPSGAGKTVLGLQIAAHLARQGMPIIIVAVEETPADLTDSGDLLGLDISWLVADNRLHFADATRMDGATVVSGAYDLSGLIHRLGAMVRRTGARALLLDSATALFSPRPSQDELRSQFFQLVSSLRELTLTSIIIAESPREHDELTTLGVEDYVCDLTILLRNIADGSRRRRSIEVNKYRRSPHCKGEYPFTITTRGLAVFPVDARQQPTDATVERFSSGVEGLDDMTHGGWLRNSIIIVRGPTGSGKTMLAGLYALAGAARGEHVAYYGFEEPRSILIRNFREIGMDVEPFIETGHLKVLCRYPEATSLEDLLVELQVELAELNPSLIVMDSVSSVEHASSEKGFRQFMIGVASMFREHGRTVLLTETLPTPGARDRTAVPYLATIADTVLALDYSTRGLELNRELRVIKMRGSGHETAPYRLSIEAGGLIVTKLTAEEAVLRP